MMIPTEEQEQIALFEWAKWQEGAHPELRWMYHVPNEGKRSRIQGANLKKQGLKPGVPDVCLPVARGGYNSLYIEMKRQQGGRLTEDQKEWIEGLTAQGNKAVRCDGWQEAAETILAYLKSGAF